ncbi:MAG TPA: SUMF1/EgtB/PvdO family nonheme iron enzyme [Myxococcota bacterium]|nr:SUMF1/EgtB/PvdO family nonheme iron enzyme [Myxococcota bacterium]HRY96050.1 SUMF1/EgtB/PvdO family nonheme iron enzyme [Myxococcota bacterium]HSA21852.1 SUMF1/EgtB/PvdO family nonheme iron enzyme [Myxococcota bacterium]
MLRIPAGEFLMGCSPGDGACGRAEKPAHSVWVSEFWMDTTEVTNAAYLLCVAAGACSMAHHDDGQCWIASGGYGWRQRRLPETLRGDDLPVVCVDWSQARGYCGWAGKRLPTEAEWERAARGGTAGASYGDLEHVAWHAVNSGGQPHPVGTRQPNAFGLYDMLGNVMEWCADSYDPDYYLGSPGVDPAGLTFRRTKVLRGGSWGFFSKTTRASSRSIQALPGTWDQVGFRCARSLAAGE